MDFADYLISSLAPCRLRASLDSSAESSLVAAFGRNWPPLENSTRLGSYEKSVIGRSSRTFMGTRPLELCPRTLGEDFRPAGRDTRPAAACSICVPFLPWMCTVCVPKMPHRCPETDTLSAMKWNKTEHNGTRKRAEIAKWSVTRESGREKPAPFSQDQGSPRVRARQQHWLQGAVSLPLICASIPLSSRFTRRSKSLGNASRFSALQLRNQWNGDEMRQMTFFALGVSPPAIGLPCSLSGG